MSPEKDPSIGTQTDTSGTTPQDDADEKRLRLNKQTLQDLSAAEADTDKVRGGMNTLRRCI